jgi:threonine dehydrogenase-like Zn-dependent dehydrogenase
MKAVCWNGVRDIRVENVPDPEILNPRDAVIKVNLAGICGSDLHLYNGFVPTMQAGDILGHEMVGEVVETGPAVLNLQVGDRVVVPFPISCGNCLPCREGFWSCCDNSNPNSWMAEKMYGHGTAGIFGYSHLMGGYAGGQAEYVRVPFADVGPMKLNGVSDEKALFVGDALATGYMAAENANLKPGDIVAIWGCGGIGLFAAACSLMLGAGRVIAIDRFPERLRLVQEFAGAETLNYEQVDVLAALKEMTGGRGPDACIDAVGMEAHSPGIGGFVDKSKQAMRMESDRPHALRQAITACRKGGVVSIPGVYSGFADMIPLGALMNKGLTIRTGQTHVHRYMPLLLQRIERGEIDPSFIITHRLPIDEAPDAYRMFNDKLDDCVRVVLKPSMS